MSKGKGSSGILGNIITGLIAGLLAALLFYFIVMRPQSKKINSIVELHVSKAEHLLEQQLFDKALIECNDIEELAIQEGNPHLDGRLALIRGKCLYSKSDYSQTEVLLKEAQVELTSAVNTLDTEKSPEKQALAQSLLATVLRGLSAIRSNIVSIDSVIALQKNALDKIDCQKDLMICLDIKTELGISYTVAYEKSRNPAFIDSSFLQLNSAIKLALHACNDLLLAQAFEKRGSAYLVIAALKDREHNAMKAVHDFEEALMLYTPNRYPQQYAIVQNSLAETYRILAEVSASGDSYLEQAQSALRKAIPYYSRQKHSMGYATLLWTLGNTYLNTFGNQGQRRQRKVCY